MGSLSDLCRDIRGTLPPSGACPSVGLCLVVSQSPWHRPALLASLVFGVVTCASPREGACSLQQREAGPCAQQQACVCSVPHSRPADCETLIRRMLVVDPAKRISIAQIRQHRWMQADPALPRACPASAALSYNSNPGDYDEQVLGIMQTLGVDRQRTVEVSAAASRPQQGFGSGGACPGGGSHCVRRGVTHRRVKTGARANLRAACPLF